MSRRFIILVMLALSAVARGAVGDGLFDGAAIDPAADTPNHVSVRAVSEYTQATPGQSFVVALAVNIDDGWILYSPDPGASATYSPNPARLVVSAGAGVKTGEPLWQADHRHVTQLGKESVANNIYERELVVYVPVTVEAGAADGERTVSLTFTGQICADMCLEVKQTAVATFTVAPQAKPNADWVKLTDHRQSARPLAALTTQHAAAAGETFPLPPVNPGVGTFFSVERLAIFATALLAGLLLNVMPCVLPVIPLKVLSLVQQARESRRRYVSLSLGFIGGIMLFFAIIAIANLVLKLAWGSAFQWGEHFQSNALRAGIALLVVAMAANLFGFYHVHLPGRLSNLAGGVQREGVAGSVGMGFLTAVLSTPCSFALLTSSLAFAQAADPLSGTVTILMIGAGMSAPFVVLTLFPSLVAHLPKPGIWMEHFKQTMGFVLLLVALWLVSTVPNSAWVAGYGVVLVFCLWMWGTWAPWGSSLRRKLWVRGIAAAIAIGAAVWMLPTSAATGVQFQDFTAGKFLEARNRNQVVLVDFTASWCLTCKTVEYVVYGDQQVARKVGDLDVLAVKGDVSTPDLPANALLKELREPGVPVSVIFPPDGREPIRLRGLFSKQDLLDALEKAAGK